MSNVGLPGRLTRLFCTCSNPMATIPATITPAMARRIEIWPTDRLVPYARNARTHSAEQIAQIAASIVEFGFTNPILVDSMDGIIAGHGRLLAARKLGLNNPIHRVNEDRIGEA